MNGSAVCEHQIAKETSKTSILRHNSDDVDFAWLMRWNHVLCENSFTATLITVYENLFMTLRVVEAFFFSYLTRLR